MIASSQKHVWWRCRRDHQWRATPYLRARSRTGCPYCANKRVWEGNSLATVAPDIAAQFDTAKNDGLTAHDVMYGSHMRVWWLCAPSGHSWQAAIIDRVHRHSGCPLCSHRRVGPDTCLAETHPGLAVELNDELNPPNIAERVTAGTAMLLWWDCSDCGHTWRASGDARVRQHASCPECRAASRR